MSVVFYLERTDNLLQVYVTVSARPVIFDTSVTRNILTYTAHIILSRYSSCRAKQHHLLLKVLTSDCGRRRFCFLCTGGRADCQKSTHQSEILRTVH